MADTTIERTKSVWCAGVALLHIGQTQSNLQRGKRDAIKIYQNKKKKPSQQLVDGFFVHSIWLINCQSKH
jgi:hypothetical protein